MSDKAIEKREEVREDVATQEKEPEVVFSPRIDIYEDGDSIRVLVDMPGADGDSVDVTVEKNTLTIEGVAKVDAPEGYEPVSREYNLGRYRRDFTLSNEVDAGKITAKARNGVLEVVVPKREDQKPRKIKIG